MTSNEATWLFSEEAEITGMRGEKRGRISCDSSSGQLDLLTRVTHATLFFLATIQRTASLSHSRPARIAFDNTSRENCCLHSRVTISFRSYAVLTFPFFNFIDIDVILFSFKSINYVCQVTASFNYIRGNV